MKVIRGGTYDEERAFYNLQNAKLIDVTFAGKKDGESALKETRNVIVEGSSFSLRYPFWHTIGFSLNSSKMDEGCRAPLWYDKNGKISYTEIRGIKGLRECERVDISYSDIVSDEFGWRSRYINMDSCSLASVYAFFMGHDINIKKMNFEGKYSFQYINDMTIDDSTLKTKDAFWHSKNVTVKDSTIDGEYLAWYSEGLTLINCHIKGTQPFCYCKKLKLINCTMENCDLAFEYSDVEADVKSRIVSIKNPRSGTIRCDEVGEIINKDSIYPVKAKVIINK
jgi:hypothetical protein